MRTGLGAHDTTTTPQYPQAPRSSRYTGLSAQATGLLNELYRAGLVRGGEWECRPTQRRLAHRFGVTERTVRRWLAELVRRGIIRVIRIARTAANIYKLVERTRVSSHSLSSRESRGRWRRRSGERDVGARLPRGRRAVEEAKADAEDAASARWYLLESPEVLAREPAAARWLSEQCADEPAVVAWVAAVVADPASARPFGR